MALTPHAYYNEFADAFQCSAEELAINKAELVSPPDIESEYFTVNKSLQKELLDKLELELVIPLN